MHARLILSAIALCTALDPTAAADPVKAGDPFPAVELKAVNADQVPGKKAGDKLSITDFQGKTVVVFFYPKALTSGCTTESCGFRDLAGKFPKDAVLVGASADGMELQQKFADAHKLPYPLLCDPDLKLIDALGVRAAGKKMAKRVTVVVGKDGKVSKVYDTVSPKDHPADVLKYVEALK